MGLFKYLTMQSIIFSILIGIILISAFPNVSAAEFASNTVLTTATFRFDNENWFTEAHPKVSEFTVEKNGDAYGFTETGVYFRQFTVTNTLGIRIQRFEIQDHYHYIVEGVPVYSLEEFSSKLAYAYTNSQSSSL